MGVVLVSDVKAPYRMPIADSVINAAVEDHRRVQQDALRNQPVVIADIVLADGTRTVVRHGLGKRYTSVFCSPVRGATATGRIVEETPTDRGREIWLTATGFGAAVTVNLLVYS
jgi:hypothetical protein